MQIIQTDRLIIVPFDMKFLKAYCEGFNAEITKYQYPEPFESEEAAREVLEWFVDQMNQGEMLFLSILTRDQQFVGGVEVHGLNEEQPELGVWIRTEFQQRGYAREALGAVMQAVEEAFQKEWYVYEADIRNVGSIRLVEQFEYRKEGLEEFETETGKALKLQRFVIRRR